MNTDRLKFSTLAIVIIIQCQAFAQISSVSGVIEKMKSHYSNKWYSNLTFKQKTSFYRNDTLQNQEIWYEAMKVGKGLVIKFDKKESGNGLQYDL